MPEGIIRDPKQNQRELDFGIVYSVERERCYKYQKEAEADSRFYLFGEVVDISDPISHEIDETECIRTHGWVTMNGYWVNQNRSPVYRRIIHPVPLQARRNAIRRAIVDDRMPSSFPPPRE